MTKEQIEQNAEEYYLHKASIGAVESDIVNAHINGALSRQPEIDELKKKVEELSSVERKGGRQADRK